MSLIFIFILIQGKKTCLSYQKEKHLNVGEPCANVIYFSSYLYDVFLGRVFRVCCNRMTLVLNSFQTCYYVKNKNYNNITKTIAM